MSPEADGLPPPAPRDLTPTEYRPSPDLRPGSTDDSLHWIRSSADLRTGPWKDAVEMRAEVGGEPNFVAFQGSGPDAFGAVNSTLEQAMFGDRIDTSTSGILLSLGSGMLTSLTSPIATITDEYQVSKIRELQAEFFKNNADDLVELSENMSTAKRAMRELAELMGSYGPNPKKLAELMEKKRRVGNTTREDIDRALERSTDPAERARLQALKAEAARQQAERDARMAAEQEELNNLNGRLHGVDAELYRQRMRMEEAARSLSPRTDTSGRGTSDFKVVGTTHTQPDAIIHATSLKDLLLGSKAGFDQHLAP